MVDDHSSAPESTAEKSERHLQTRRTQKREAVESLMEIISSIAAAWREPDEWEQTHLVRALASISSGCYVLAKTQARLAKVLPEQRSLKTNLTVKLTREYNLAQIGLRLQEVAAGPVLMRQTFEFIELCENSGADVVEASEARSAGAST